MKANSQVDVLDLRPALLQAKSKGLIYLKTDSHWNQRGSFIACQEIVGRVAKRVPGLPRLDAGDFDETFSDELGGNLAMMLAARETLRENHLVALVPVLPPKKWTMGKLILFIDVLVFEVHR